MAENSFFHFGLQARTLWLHLPIEPSGFVWTLRSCISTDTSLTCLLEYLVSSSRQFEQLKQRRNDLHMRKRDLKRELDRCNASRYDLQYQDPDPNFDRRKVRGMVGKLFQLNDMKNSMALVQAAGGSVSSEFSFQDYSLNTIYFSAIQLCDG